MSLNHRSEFEFDNQLDDPLESTVISTIPISLGLLGTLVIVVSIANAVSHASINVVSQVVTNLIGLLLLILSQLFYKKEVDSKVMSWSCTAASSLLVAELAWDAVRLEHPVSLTFGVISLVLLPSIVLNWTAAAVGGAIQLAILATAGAFVKTVQSLDYAIAAIAALLAGMILLRIRLKSVEVLSVEKAKIQRLATTDFLTNLLTRNGLISLADNMFRSMDRKGTNVYVVLCEIKEMRVINGLYGIDFGDSLIYSVGRAMKLVNSPHNLISRWDGDTFLSIGVEPISDAATISTDMEAALITSGIAMGKHPVKISVGTACGEPGEVTLEQLVESAKHQMIP